MLSYCVVAVLALLASTNAQKDVPVPCSKQMELEHRCMLTVETSPEAQMIKDRMKQAIKTCAPDYPEECHARFEAAHECATSIQKNADTDSVLQKTKAQSQPAIDECFQKYPPNVKEGVMEIFMNMKPQHHGPPKFHKKRHHGHRNATSGEASGETSGQSSASASGESSGENMGSASNETSASSERRHHRGGGGGGHGGHGGRGGRCHHRRHHRHHGHRNATLAGNNTSSASGSASKGKSGGKSGRASGSASKERHHRGGWSGQKQDDKCRKTKEQHECVKQEFKKLGNDTAFVDVMNTLIRQKQKCKQLVDWSCQVKGCPKRAKCVFKATKPCREAFMEKMKTCLGEKGFTLPPYMMKHAHDHTTVAFTTPMPDMEQ